MPGYEAMVLAAALAAPPTIELRWTAPPECPQLAELRARTTARLGPDARTDAEVDARVVASPTDYMLTLDVALQGAAPVHRELATQRCDELVDAAALMIAVAVDPLQVAATPAIVRALAEPSTHASIASGPRAPAARAVRPSAEVPTSPEPPRPRVTAASLGIALRPSVGVWFGAMPDPALAIGFDIVVPARRALRAELGVLAIPRQRHDVAPEAGAQLWLAIAVLRACFAPAAGRVRPMGCAGLGAGAIGGRGRGEAVPLKTPGTEAWVSATASAGLGIALLRHLELFVRAEGHAHLRRPAFHLDEIGPVHRVGATSVTALGGLQAVLP